MRTVSEGQEYLETWNFQLPNCDKKLQTDSRTAISAALAAGRSQRVNDKPGP